MPLIQDLTTFFDQVTRCYRTDQWDRLGENYTFPVLYTYEDMIVPIHDVDGLISEAKLLVMAMRSVNTVQIKATPRVTNQNARDRHIPVWVDYEVIGPGNRLNYKFTSNFYCEIRPDGQFRIESVSMPFQRQTLISRANGAA